MSAKNATGGAETAGTLPSHGGTSGIAHATFVGMSDEPFLMRRTRQFALASIAFYKRLPKTPDAQVPGVQYLKSSTAVDSNYRAAKGGRSRAEFIAKLGIVVEEIEESANWLEMMRDARIANDPSLLSEAYELRRIFGKSLRTARINFKNKKAGTANSRPPA